MNKSQLIDTLAERFEGNRKAAAHALDSVIDTITREVAKGEKVAITGFGSFEKRVREARWVRNPRTGERIQAKKTAIPKFSAGADLKAVVSGAKKLPELTVAAVASGARAVTPGKSAKKDDSSSGGASSTAKRATSKTASAGTSAAKKAAGSSGGSSTAKKTGSSSTAKKSPAKKSTAKKASSSSRSRSGSGRRSS